MIDPLRGIAILGTPFVESPLIPEGFIVVIGHNQFGLPELQAVIKLEPKGKEADHAAQD